MLESLPALVECLPSWPDRCVPPPSPPHWPDRKPPSDDSVCRRFLTSPSLSTLHVAQNTLKYANPPTGNTATNHLTRASQFSALRTHYNLLCESNLPYPTNRPSQTHNAGAHDQSPLHKTRSEPGRPTLPILQKFWVDPIAPVSRAQAELRSRAGERNCGTTDYQTPSFSATHSQPRTKKAGSTPAPAFRKTHKSKRPHNIQPRLPTP